jgi:chromosome segregation ATPase
MHDQTLVPNTLGESAHQLVLQPVYIEKLTYEHHEHRYAEDTNLRYYQTQITRDQSQLDETKTAYEQIRKERDTLKASFDAVQKEKEQLSKRVLNLEHEKSVLQTNELESKKKLDLSEGEWRKYYYLNMSLNANNTRQQINELELKKKLNQAEEGWRRCYSLNTILNANRTGL